MKLVKGTVIVMALFVSHNASAVSFWGSVKNAFNDCKYSSAEYKETYQTEVQTTPRLQDHFFGAFSEQDFFDKPWMQDFRYVIVVNRAAKGPTAQTMRVYDKGYLVMNKKVSTGRENFELRRKNKVCAGAPPKSYWSQTPTGFYTPKFLSKDHKSSSWDSDMPFAIFYDVDNGLALHQVYHKYASLLGQRASGGCTRQDPASAEELFNRVKETERAIIPEINVDGTPVLDENGQVKYIGQQLWMSAVSNYSQKFNTFSALIIVEDVPY
ncbi:MAG: L,D-transpeptidase [Bdellovibrio sp.]